MHDRLSVRTTAMLVIAWLTLAAAPGAAQNRGLRPTDFYSEVGVGEVAISPDGALVAFTVTTVNEEDNRRHREVWMQELRAGRPEGEPFRFTDPTREVNAPRWSPDSRVLSFQSRRGDKSRGSTRRRSGRPTAHGSPTRSGPATVRTTTKPSATGGLRPTPSPTRWTPSASTDGSSPRYATSATAR